MSWRVHRDYEGEYLEVVGEAVSKDVDVNNEMVSKQQEDTHFLNTGETESLTHPGQHTFPTDVPRRHNGSPKLYFDQVRRGKNDINQENLDTSLKSEVLFYA